MDYDEKVDVIAKALDVFDNETSPWTTQQARARVALEAIRSSHEPSSETQQILDYLDESMIRVKDLTGEFSPVVTAMAVEALETISQALRAGAHKEKS